MEFCPHCGVQVSADEAYCHNCGFNLKAYRLENQNAALAHQQENVGSQTSPASASGPQSGSVPPVTRRRQTSGGSPNHPKRPWLIVTLVLLAAVVIVGGVLYFQNRSQQTQEAASSSASASAASASSASIASASASASQAAASSSLAASQEAASESLANASESRAESRDNSDETDNSSSGDLSNRDVAKMAADLDDFDLDDYRVEVKSPAVNMKEVDVYDKDSGELYNKYRYDEIHDQMSKYDDDSGKWELIKDSDD